MYTSLTLTHGKCLTTHMVPPIASRTNSSVYTSSPPRFPLSFSLSLRYTYLVPTGRLTIKGSITKEISAD